MRIIDCANNIYVVAVISAICGLSTTVAIDAGEDEIATEQEKDDFINVFLSQIDLLENQNIGCLFDNNLCKVNERCIDDSLFGTCVAAYASGSQFSYSLPDDLVIRLKSLLAGLVQLNYTWRDSFTQCNVRAILLASSMETDPDLSVCDRFVKIKQAERELSDNYKEESREAMKREEPLRRNKYEYFLDIPERRGGVGVGVGVEESPTDYGYYGEEERANWLRDVGDNYDPPPQLPFPNYDVSRAAFDAKSTRLPAEEALQLAEANGEERESGVPPQSISLPAEVSSSSSRRQSPHSADAAAIELAESADPTWPDWRAEEASMATEEAREKEAEAEKEQEENSDKDRYINREESRLPISGTAEKSAEEKAVAMPPPPPPPPPPKRHSTSQVIDAAYMWVAFDSSRSVSAPLANALIDKLNDMSDSPVLAKQFRLNTASNEIYFTLSSGVMPSKLRPLMKSISSDPQLKYRDYGFGQPGNRVQASELSASWEQQTRVTTTLLVCSVVIAMIVSLFVVFIVQRFRSSKRKLREMTSSTGYDSSDYQDLCRQRASGQQHEKCEPVCPAGAQHLVTAKSGSPHSSTGSWTEDPITTDMDITTGHLILNYMEEYLNNKEKLEQEWASLCSYEAEQASSAAGATPENAGKNRYQDVLPYDHSRVKLNQDGEASPDYINASFVYDSDPKVKSYVLTQGPTESTASDFWQMLWECGSVTIVNLTKTGADLCYQYWPENGSRLFNQFEVHLVSEHVWCEDFVVRNFYLKNLGTGEARTVTMFHFLTWEETGLPSSAKTLLEFRRKVNKSYKGRSSPVVIHCNDGCGRSGTFCLLDMALNRINKGVKEIDLAASLEHLRDQRPGLVKTKDQFEFAVTAIAEEVHSVLKTLPQ